MVDGDVDIDVSATPCLASPGRLVFNDFEDKSAVFLDLEEFLGATAAFERESAAFETGSVFAFGSGVFLERGLALSV